MSLTHNVREKFFQDFQETVSRATQQTSESAATSRSGEIDAMLCGFILEDDTPAFAENTRPCADMSWFYRA